MVIVQVGNACQRERENARQGLPATEYSFRHFSMSTEPVSAVTRSAPASAEPASVQPSPAAPVSPVSVSLPEAKPAAGTQTLSSRDKQLLIVFGVLVAVGLVVALLYSALKGSDEKETKTCGTNEYGPNCSTCPNCGTHGHCMSGSSGSGACSCDAGWSGTACDVATPGGSGGVTAPTSYPLTPTSVPGTVPGAGAAGMKKANNNENTYDKRTCTKGSSVLVGCTAFGTDGTRGATIEKAKPFSDAECVAAAHGRDVMASAQCVPTSAASPPFEDLAMVQSSDVTGTGLANCLDLGSDYRLLSCSAKATTGIPEGAVINGNECQSHGGGKPTRAVAWCAKPSPGYTLDVRPISATAKPNTGTTDTVTDVTCPAGYTLTGCTAYSEHGVAEGETSYQGTKGTWFSGNTCSMKRRAHNPSANYLYGQCIKLVPKA